MDTVMKDVSNLRLLEYESSSPVFVNEGILLRDKCLKLDFSIICGKLDS